MFYEQCCREGTDHLTWNLPAGMGGYKTRCSVPSILVRGTAWYSLATRGLVWRGGVGGGVGSVVSCSSYSNG